MIDDNTYIETLKKYIKKLLYMLIYLYKLDISMYINYECSLVSYNLLNKYISDFIIHTDTDERFIYSCTCYITPLN